MKHVKLGESDLTVSEACLGSMTWGAQNTEAEAHEQIEFALNKGINFIDTAEMYAVPPRPETYGKTEEYIGTWLAKNRERRKDIVLTSKIAGKGVKWIRSGKAITADTIMPSIDASLARLQTDYIDLYQLHWPNRENPHFSRHWPGALDYQHTSSEQEDDNFLEVLEALNECIKAGKVRHYGLSNESPWGISEYDKVSLQNELPKMISIQNEFSLLHLKDSPYVMESCALAKKAYLVWSPLAGGVLTGKYRNGERPLGSRWTISQRHGLFRDTPFTHAAIEYYHDIAEQADLSLAQLSLAWVNQVPEVTSTIIGATSIKQLEENISAFSITLEESTLDDINAVIRQFPVPF